MCTSRTTPSTAGLVTSLMLVAVASAAPQFAQCGDFDGDGFDDIPIGSPRLDGATDLDIGGMNLLYGSNNGLTAAGDQLFSRETPGVQGAEPTNRTSFAWSVASGDFDDDGFDDLVVGVPGDEIGTTHYLGTVNVLYGRGSGVSLAGDQLWHPGVAGVQGGFDGDSDMYFGWALAVGDFDGDGFDDLAIGAPNTDVNGVAAAGVVHVLYGSNAGLRATGDQRFSQATAGIQDEPGVFDRFGRALAAGDFDGDGRDDLAIGIRSETVDGVDDCGAVTILYGTSGGLSAAGDDFFTQDTPGIADDPQNSGFFGESLAVGDFDGDGRDDLAIGAPGQDIAGQNFAGAVHVLYGTSSGLSAVGDDYFTQNTSGIPDAPGEFDEFGVALASGDFDGDGRDDLAIGASGEDLGFEATGAAHILYGGATGLRATGDQFLSLDTPGVVGSAQGGETFGSAFYVGDFDDDGRDDLGIAAPRAEVDGVGFAGIVLVFYGKNGGLSLSGEQLWSQNTAGIQGAAESGGRFGCLNDGFVD